MRFRRGSSTTGRSSDSSHKLEQAPLNSDFASNYSPRGVASPSYDFGKNQRRPDNNNYSTNRLRSTMGHLPFGDETDSSKRRERKKKKSSRRAISVGRAMTSSPSRWREGRKSGGSSSRRAMSTGRAMTRQRRRNSDNNDKDSDLNVPKYVTHPSDGDASSVSQPGVLADASESNDYTDRTEDNLAVITEADKEGKKKKSKMEKIRQLQAKNELYKTEFKRVQKDRKKLKKDLETKTLEVESLTKEIDTYISETSALKSKLSEALQQLDRTDQDGRKVSTEISDLTAELEQAQDDLKSSQDRVAELLEELNAMKESVQRKDDQIKSLTREITEESHQIEMLRNETTMVRRLHEQEIEKEKKKQEQLLQKNEKLQSEHGSTLERAAAMVKEREDAIADLLRENDEMKRMLDRGEGDVSGQEVNELREKLSAKAVALEQAEDRIVLLEEDIESWMRREHELEAEIVELREEADTWQEKAMAAQHSKDFVDNDVRAKEMEIQAARKALKDMETKYKTQFAEMEIKLRAAQMAAEEKEGGSRSSSPASVASSGGSEKERDVQTMSLAEIVEQKKKREAAKRATGWALFGKAGPEEELDENQKKIKELEKLNEEQTDELKKLKSELVRLRSTYNETTYLNKKKIEKLESENEALEKRIGELERELNGARAKSPDLLPNADDGSTEPSS